MRLTVTAAHSADHPQLLRIWEVAVRATHHFLDDAQIRGFRTSLASDWLPQMPMLAVAFDTNGNALGFVGVAGAKVEMLFVDPAVHRTGVGKALLAHAVQVWGAREVDVNEQNPQALRFYLRLGFEQFGRSELDGTGLPFPLLHLRLGDAGGFVAA